MPEIDVWSPRAAPGHEAHTRLGPGNRNVGFRWHAAQVAQGPFAFLASARSWWQAPLPDEAMNRLASTLIALIAAACCSASLHAATYCATNELELWLALDEFGDNGEDDEIRIQAGTFDSNVNPFY